MKEDPKLYAYTQFRTMFIELGYRKKMRTYILNIKLSMFMYVKMSRHCVKMTSVDFYKFIESAQKRKHINQAVRFILINIE